MAYPFQTPYPQYDLANQTNQFMSSQAALPYRMNLPNYQALIQGESNNILDLVGGEIPDDVINQILQGAAERGIATGVRGDSPNAGASYLRALGLTSLGLQQQGAQRLSAAVERTPVPEIWNPMSLYVPERLAAQELAVASGETGSGWKSQSQQPWFINNRWTSPSGA